MVDGLLNVAIIAKKNTSLRFLATLESIKKQEYAHIRLVVVDANEQNSIYSLGLQEDLSSYPEVEYLNLEQPFSIGKIRNLLVDYLDGEYIAFLNGNDIWDANMTQFQINILKKEPLAVASCVNGILIDERKSGKSVEPLRETMVEEKSKWVLHNPVKMPAQIIYKREAIKRVGGFDEQFTSLSDADMVLRLSNKTKVLVSEISLCECRLTSRHHDYELNLYSDLKKLKLKHINYFIVNKRLSQEYYGQMIKLAIDNYVWLDLLIYAVMYFIKAPSRTFYFLLKELVHLIYYGLKYIYRGLSLIKDRIQISKNIFLTTIGRQYKLKSIKPIVSSYTDEGQELSFLSAKHYNDQSSLKYVFNKKVTSIIIPNYVTVIKKGMFYGCKQLISVEIPNTVIEIQDHAFHNCNNLRNVKFQKNSSLNKIGRYAFAGCAMLKELKLPSSVTQLGAYSFSECYSLKQLIFADIKLFPTSIEKLPKFIFAGCRSLLSVEFESNSILDKIEKGAFLACRNLTKTVFTGRVKSLGAYAFAACNMIESVAFLQIDSLETIGKSAFMNCEALPYFQLPNGLNRIRARTFYSCSKLKYIKIPKSVLSINHQAFKKCSSLFNVTILTGDIMISPTAFENHTKIDIQENVNIDKD